MFALAIALDGNGAPHHNENPEKEFPHGFR